MSKAIRTGVLFAIRGAAVICRDNGIEPNRIRLGRLEYSMLLRELGDVTVATSVDGLRVEVHTDCPRWHVYVDYAPAEVEE